MKGALDAIAATLDPPIDQYSSRQALCRLTWEPGQSVDHFFYTAKLLAAEFGVDIKFVASLVASQLPRDVESKVKGAVVGIVGDLEIAESRELLVNIKRELRNGGHSLEKGYRDVERVTKVASLSEHEKMSFGSTPANADLSGLDGDEFVPTAETIAYTRPSDKKGRKFRTQPTQFKAVGISVEKTTFGGTIQRSIVSCVETGDTQSIIVPGRKVVPPRIVSCRYPTGVLVPSYPSYYP